MKKLLLTYSLLIITYSIFAQGYTINIIAGNSDAGFAGDGGPATNAEFLYPNGVTTDSKGNVYIADLENNRIRKVSTSNIITTIAGKGGSGSSYGAYSGDGGAATAANLAGPSGVATDDSDNIYIVDGGNARIRMINTQGIITTIVGNGVAGFAGDNGPATAAEINPYDIAIDDYRNLYIADVNNNRIRMVNTNGIITTIAGNGAKGFAGDSGAATAAEIYEPYGVGVDNSGNVYIADTYNSRIRKVNTNGMITTIAGNQYLGYMGDNVAATATSLNESTGVAVDDSGNVYIADIWNSRIRMVNTNGIITTIAGGGSFGPENSSGGPATAAGLNSPVRIYMNSFGNLYIADRDGFLVYELTGGAPTQVNKISANSNGVTIYPVPGNGNFTVALKGSGYQLLTVYDETGKQLLSKVLNKKNVNSTIALDMSMYANGIYFAKIIADKGIVNKKIVIQK